MEEHAKFGGGVNDSVLHPVVLVAMLLAAILIFVLPRKHVLIPVLASTFLIPLGQQFVVAGLHVFVLRIIILLGLLRAFSAPGPGGRSALAGGWNRVDTAFTWYVVIQALATVILYKESQAIINQIGFIWDCLGGYLVLRALIHTDKDIFRAVKCLAVLSVLLAAGMIIEQYKMLNVFGLLGGARLIPELREGKIRSQGVFEHSLMAGTYAATLIPLLLMLWKNGKSKLMAGAGLVAATAMTITTQTSTSLITYAAALGALFLWPLRKKMKQVRWAIVGGLLALQLVMKAPVWFLIARVDLTGSSSSYHRAELIDQFVNHFSDWWLIGTRTAHTWGWDMWDAQNMYVSVGEGGGLAALVFFILVLAWSFGQIGKTRRLAESKNQEWFLWFLGAALFAHVVGFLGVNYFDQSRMAWYVLLAIISAHAAVMTRAKRQPVLESPGVQREVLVAELPEVEPALALSRIESQAPKEPVARGLFHS